MEHLVKAKNGQWKIKKEADEEVEKAELPEKPNTLDYSKFNKPAPPGGRSTIDYSKFSRPTDDKTGQVKPIHKPFQHSPSKYAPKVLAKMEELKANLEMLRSAIFDK